VVHSEFGWRIFDGKNDIALMSIQEQQELQLMEDY
jgi:hypothetical protein